MSQPTEPKLSQWPFFLGDALLLGAAGGIYAQSHLPMGPWQIGLVVACVAGAAWLGVLPFVLEYRLLLKRLEVEGWSATVAPIHNLEAVAGQISEATGRWQMVQEQAEKLAAAAKGLTERMSTEVQAFSEFQQRANDSEKATLRLEIDKLRRAEAEWLQVSVRLLDHVYALHVGALRSGQAHLIEQLTHFQNACRDTARRVGLSPFVAGPAESFDPKRHQAFEAKEAPAPGAPIAETLASGYTFQGQLLRPALVRLAEDSPQPAAPASA